MVLVPQLAKFDLTGMPEVITKANKRFTDNEMRSFRRTIDNWSAENRPSFKRVGVNVGLGIIEYKVFTNSKIYHWVNYGTDPHKIRPVRAKALRFQEGYVPKTRANKIQSTGSGERFGDFKQRAEVTQSIAPRDFVGQIKEKASERWSRAVDAEIKIYIQRNVK